MISQGWGQDNPAFRQFFTSLFMPGATKEQMDWFNELQRTTISPENALRLREVSGNVDVRNLLGQIEVPTLVLHCRDDGIVAFEKGRRMASMIPNARFVALEGHNHLILEDEPAWPRFLEEVSRFLALDDA
jgi:pimeloyl-ACP methyl ester carboxylesterase